MSTNPRRRRMIKGMTYEEITKCGKMYITVNTSDKGIIQEVFIRLGKAGGCAAAQNEVIGRVISLALRKGLDPCDIFNQVTDIKCLTDNSCAAAVANVLKRHAGECI